MFGATTVVRVDRYEIQEPLGGGGMGVVFAAWDPELRRRVAIKLVQVRDPAKAGDDGAARLLREAQAIARISHPHVVPVHDVGTYGDGEVPVGLPGAATRGVFLVMELVDGVDLGRWLEERRRPWPEVLAAYLDAGEGLAAAHACGILHRDFKPTNVLVGRDGRVRVLDFGLARAIDDAALAVEAHDVVAGADAALGDSLTNTGAVLGTPYFMSPEQLAGGTTDARSDQYAFCVALYHGLVGTGPFARGPLRDLADAKRRGIVLPLPEHAGVPRWLERAVLRGLDPDPEKRFASMRALLDTLERGRRRRRTIVRGALLAGTVALAVGMGLGLGRLREPEPVAPALVSAPERQAPRIAFLPFVVDADGEDLAWAVDGMPNLMAEELRGHEGLDVVGYYRLERRLVDQPRARWAALAAEQGATVIVNGSASRTGDVIELRVEAVDERGTVVLSRTASTEPAALVEGARRLARGVGSDVLGRPLEGGTADPRPLSYDRSLQLGIAALERFHFAEAEAHLDEARRLAPEAAEVHFYGAIVADWMGRQAEAEAELDVAARGALPDSKRLFVAAFRKGVQREYAAAVTEYEAALRRYPDDIYLAYGLFEALYHAGRGDAAVAAFRRLHALAPGFAAGVSHVLDRAAARRDGDTLAWAIEVIAATDSDAADVWRARERIMHGDPRGALALVEPLVDRSTYGAEIAVAASALAGDVELARARADQMIGKGVEDLELAHLALCTAMGDDAGRRASFDRERARLGRLPQSDHKALGFVALVVHELPLGADERIAELSDGFAAAVSPRFVGDLRIEMARVLVAGARGDGAGLAAARASAYEEVQQAALAFGAAAGDDHRAAAEHWRRAAALALDARFLFVERWLEAREREASGDHEGVITACAEVVQPASFDWSWGSTVGPCLAWTAAAHDARGESEPAERARARLLALRSRAPATDALRIAVGE